jgi:hypothetical protein
MRCRNKPEGTSRSGARTFFARSFPSTLLPSSTQPHENTTIAAFTNNHILHEIFLAKFAENNEFDIQTRALAQDDNSEPRRSPIQVLTAQRFSPKSLCFDLRVSLHLTTTTSCVSFLLCVCFLFRRQYSPQRIPMDSNGFHRILSTGFTRPGKGILHGHFLSVFPSGYSNGSLVQDSKHVVALPLWCL